ncbi:response regulator transcription factor [Serratia fonticola]|uniref:response regulator transcription factor n=1 Tax=Serratia fonticola TaxID=47917 RepID=UPI00351AECDA
MLSDISEIIVLSKNAKPTRTLTTREINVLRHLVKGHKNKEIAEHLFISEKTVSTYKTRIMAKLGVNSVIEMVNYAGRNGLM